MLTSSTVAAPLLGRAHVVRSVPMPLAPLQRPRVLARPTQAPQQLSLFGPLGGQRR